MGLTTKQRRSRARRRLYEQALRWDALFLEDLRKPHHRRRHLGYPGLSYAHKEELAQLLSPRGNWVEYLDWYRTTAGHLIAVRPYNDSTAYSKILRLREIPFPHLAAKIETRGWNNLPTLLIRVQPKALGRWLRKQRKALP